MSVVSRNLTEGGMRKRNQNKETWGVYMVMAVTAVAAVFIAHKLGIRRSRSVFSILVGIELALYTLVTKFIPQNRHTGNEMPIYAPYDEMKNVAKGYVNEFVPEQEKRSFPVPESVQRFTPEKWTINREKNCILFKYQTDKENPADEYFIFVFEGRVIGMVLDGSEFVGAGTVKWKITQISIPEDLNRDRVFTELREALAVYGCFGEPFGEERAVTDF